MHRADEVVRPPLHLDVDPADVLAEHTDADQLNQESSTGITAISRDNTGSLLLEGLKEPLSVSHVKICQDYLDVIT